MKTPYLLAFGLASQACTPGEEVAIGDAVVGFSDSVKPAEAPQDLDTAQESDPCLEARETFEDVLHLALQDPKNPESGIGNKSAPQSPAGRRISSEWNLVLRQANADLRAGAGDIFNANSIDGILENPLTVLHAANNGGNYFWVFPGSKGNELEDVNAVTWTDFNQAGPFLYAVNYEAPDKSLGFASSTLLSSDSIHFLLVNCEAEECSLTGDGQVVRVSSGLNRTDAFIAERGANFSKTASKLDALPEDPACPVESGTFDDYRWWTLE